MDGDGAGDLLVAYTPQKANNSSGALKRFELTNNDSTWTEVPLNLRISSDSVISVSDYYGAVFAPKIAVLKDNTVSIVALFPMKMQENGIVILRLDYLISMLMVSLSKRRDITHQNLLS